MEWVKTVKDNFRNYRNRSKAVNSDEGRTEFSLLSTISLPNVSLEDAGRYICIASHNSSTLRQDEDHEKLHVVPIIPPLVNMTNMKGDSITPLEGTQHELICGIYGRPKVEIQWLKDDQPINQSKYLSIDSGVSYQGHWHFFVTCSVPRARN